MKFYRFYLIFVTLSLALFNPSASAKINKKIIYIYKDEGVSPHALLQAMHTFKTVLPASFTVKTIDAKGVIKNDWSRDAALFVMPGGADLPYAKKLNGAGNDHIKNYIQNGGSYLGLCAGAYYAASHIEFDKKGPLEVMDTRELAFFEGKAIGPILAKYDYKTESGARAAKINITLSNIKEATVYYNGGGYFENGDNIKNTTVIGYYTNQQPAIISINYAKGHVVLSGVHFEYDPALLDPNDPFLVNIIPELKSSNKKRLVLVNEVLKQLHLIHL
jgi:glutamine amidotransferase-like uncharacterized protein